jgi:hypothetical protein
LNKALNLLESARNKGYVCQSDLEEKAYQAKSQWDIVRPQVEAVIAEQSGGLHSNLRTFKPSIQRLKRIISNLSATESALRDTSTQTKHLMCDAENIERKIENSYGDIETEVHQLNSRMTQIH